MRRFVAVDLETTGLDPDRHEIIEVGLAGEGLDGKYFEATFALPFNLEDANPEALAINGWGKRPFPPRRDPQNSVGFLYEVLRDCHIVGKNPKFDVDFLEKLFGLHQVMPTWHYRLVDVGNLAWGWYMGGFPGEPVEQPPNVEKVEDMVSIKRETWMAPDAIEFHTALYDARWAYKVFRMVVPK